MLQIWREITNHLSVNHIFYGIEERGKEFRIEVNDNDY